MWQFYLLIGAVILSTFTVALIFFARQQRKLGEAEIKTRIAEKAAGNAEIIADIATNDKPSDVNERLRHGVF